MLACWLLIHAFGDDGLCIRELVKDRHIQPPPQLLISELASHDC
jgi:hypothetical protein